MNHHHPPYCRNSWWEPSINDIKDRKDVFFFLRRGSIVRYTERYQRHVVWPPDTASQPAKTRGRTRSHTIVKGSPQKKRTPTLTPTNNKDTTSLSIDIYRLMVSFGNLPHTVLLGWPTRRERDRQPLGMDSTFHPKPYNRNPPVVPYSLA